MIRSFLTDRPGEEQSDQGLHCLPFRLHLLDSLLYGRAALFKFRIITAIFRVSEYLGDFYGNSASKRKKEE